MITIQSVPLNPGLKANVDLLDNEGIRETQENKVLVDQRARREKKVVLATQVTKEKVVPKEMLEEVFPIAQEGRREKNAILATQVTRSCWTERREGRKGRTWIQRREGANWKCWSTRESGSCGYTYTEWMQLEAV